MVYLYVQYGHRTNLSSVCSHIIECVSVGHIVQESADTRTKKDNERTQYHKSNQTFTLY